MFVIPMGGLSARFSAAGYTVPKYMLPIAGGSLFDLCVSSFSAYFDSDEFLFICREDDREFVSKSASNLRIKNFSVEILSGPTRGQADTVALGLNRHQMSSGTVGPVTIFNIDTFRPAFQKPAFAHYPSGGYLETFVGSGSNWSYVRTAAEGSYDVVETAEKRPISNFCCTGLYGFANSRLYLEIFALYEKTWTAFSSEMYVAPMFNLLVERGYVVKMNLIERSEVHFSGVPQEYEELARLLIRP